MYGQQVQLFRLGRMPAQVLAERQGIARYVHNGYLMNDTRPNRDLLDLMDELIREQPGQLAGGTRIRYV
jgi:peroxiredoxin Q/BCP